jgi:hypothetical protein
MVPGNSFVAVKPTQSGSPFFLFHIKIRISLMHGLRLHLPPSGGGATEGRELIWSLHF